MALLSPIKTPVLLLALAVVEPVLAEVSRQEPRELLDAGYLFQVLGSLLLVSAGIFGLVLLLKKLNGLPTVNKAAIRVLGSVRLGSREKVVLMQAGEQQLLIGVAAGSIRTLHTFEEPIAGLDSESGQLPGMDFAALLNKSKSGGES